MSDVVAVEGQPGLSQVERVVGSDAHLGLLEVRIVFFPEMFHGVWLC
jgi:hypothetical protein